MITLSSSSPLVKSIVIDLSALPPLAVVVLASCAAESSDDDTFSEPLSSSFNCVDHTAAAATSASPLLALLGDQKACVSSLASLVLRKDVH
jgi:hypothetical protein